MRWRHRLVLVTLLAIACSEREPTTVPVSLPSTTLPIDSMVVLVDGPELTPRVFARSLPLSEEVIRVDVDQQDATVTVLYSKLNLEDLGLPEGEIPLANPDLPSRSLPAVEEMYQAQLVEDHLSAFARVERLPDRLAQLSLENEKAVECGNLIFTPIILSEPDALPPIIPYVIPLDDRTIVVATSTGPFLRVVDRNVEVMENTPSNVPRMTGWRTSDGTIWLLGADGAVARSDPDLRLEFSSPSPTAPQGSYLYVDGSPNPPLELFATSEGLWRFHDGVWTKLADASFAVFRRALYVGPNEALFSGPDSPIIRFRGGTRTVEDLGDPSGFTGAMTLVDGVPYVSLTKESLSAIYRQDRSSWERVIEVDFPNVSRILAMTSTSDGFYFGAGTGHFGEILRGAGACPRMPVPPPRGIGFFWGVTNIIRVSASRYLIVSHGLDTLAPSAPVTVSGLTWMEVR